MGFVFDFILIGATIFVALAFLNRMFPGQVSAFVRSLVNNPFAEFVYLNKSLSAAFAYIIVTGVIMSVSIMSLITHGIAYILVFTMRWQAHRQKASKTTSIMMLSTIALTALMTDFDRERIMMQILSVAILSFMWWLSVQESKSVVFMQRA